MTPQSHFYSPHKALCSHPFILNQVKSSPQSWWEDTMFLVAASENSPLWRWWRQRTAPASSTLAHQLHSDVKWTKPSDGKPPLCENVSRQLYAPQSKFREKVLLDVSWPMNTSHQVVHCNEQGHLTSRPSSVMCSDYSSLRIWKEYVFNGASVED